jgi:hypothetical protein
LLQLHLPKCHLSHQSYHLYPRKSRWSNHLGGSAISNSDTSSSFPDKHPMHELKIWINHGGGSPVVKTWDQKICFLCDLKFEPCGCSYNSHYRLTWSLTSEPVRWVKMRTSCSNNYIKLKKKRFGFELVWLIWCRRSRLRSCSHFYQSVKN